MPWYCWKAECCNTEAYVINSVEEQDQPPQGGCFCGKIVRGESKWELVKDKESRIFPDMETK